MDRDPRVSPMVGDKVQGIWAMGGIGGEPEIITCEAICGNLIAISSSCQREPSWIRSKDWCEASAWVKEYKVLYAAQ